MPTLAQQHNHDFKKGPFEVFKNGKLTYFENSLGYWFTHKFDSKGREIYYESSQRFWYKCEYDSNGNLSFAKESHPCYTVETKFEYDSNGNKIAKSSRHQASEFEYHTKTTYDSNGQVLHREESEIVDNLSEKEEQSNTLKGIYKDFSYELILLGGLLLIGITLFACY